MYDCKDNRNYKSNIVDGQELNSSYYLTDAMGHTLAIKNLKDSLGVKLETWAYFLFGTQREAKLNLSSMNESHMFQSNEVTFYIYDHLGNTRLTHTPGVTGGASACMAYTYIHYLAEYFHYGKVLREYIPNEQERYMTTTHACPTKECSRKRDKETELDYRGARYYDSDVARFLSLDPLANKFPAWSAYNYVMGNPIMLIDPDGRSPQDIIIQNAYKDKKGNDKTFSVTYKDGKLFDSSGKEYTAKKGGYMETVQNDLKNLEKESTRAKNVIDRLENSSNTHTITNDDIANPQHKNIGNYNIGPANGNTTTKYEANNRFTVAGTERTPRVGLAHELTHAYDKDRGNSNYLNNSIRGVELTEIHAVNIENTIRAKTGDPKRTDYSGTPIHEPYLH